MAAQKVKRKDTYWKNGTHRVLHDGEYQRTAGGKYEYRYKTPDGKKHSVYSWRLNSTDIAPKGHESEFSLREMEAQIKRAMDTGIKIHHAEKATLNDCFAMYIARRSNSLKQSTATNYKFMWQRYIQDSSFVFEYEDDDCMPQRRRIRLGHTPVKDIDYSMIYNFYVYLHKEGALRPDKDGKVKGLRQNTLDIIQTLIHPALGEAVKRRYILSNPSDSVMKDFKNDYGNGRKKRHGLTEEETELFIDYCKNHPTYHHWLNLFTVFLGTGCRVAEITGLRWEDIDFRLNEISINHNLVYRVQDSGKCEFHITTPKTEAGMRTIPLFDDVKEALLSEREFCMENGFCQGQVDGYEDFVFQNRFHDLLSPHCINRAIERIRQEANKAEAAKAKSEHRRPIVIPHFSCHHLRHTFCTRVCERTDDFKFIEGIMGHADISTTMDVYNELTDKHKHQSMSKLNGTFRIR